MVSQRGVGSGVEVRMWAKEEGPYYEGPSSLLYGQSGLVTGELDARQTSQDHGHRTSDDEQGGVAG